MSLDIERTDRLDIVAEKIDSDRKIGRVAIYVEDRPTDRELAGLVDIVGLGEIVFTQPLLGLGQIKRTARNDDERMSFKIVTGRDTLGESFGIGDNKSEFLRCRKGRESLGPQYA